MQGARDKFQELGLGLAAVSYDNAEILADFSQRHGITYPLIADPASDLIRKYDVLNAEATGFTKGMALPGYFFVTPDGTIKEKFFETAYTDRHTANSLLLSLFPQLVEGEGREIAAPYLKLTLLQSDKVVAPGSRFTVTAEVELPADTHVYSPDVKGYIPVALVMEDTPGFELQKQSFPKAETLFLPAINERVPVFTGRFRIHQQVVVASDRAFRSSLGDGKVLRLNGVFHYQACNKTTCFRPQEARVSWDFKVIGLNTQRSPDAIRHK